MTNTLDVTLENERLKSDENLMIDLIQDAWHSGNSDFQKTCQLSECIHERLIHLQTPNIRISADSMVLKAFVLVKKDQLFEALTLSKEALEIFVQLSDNNGLARVHRVLCLIYGRMGRLEDCIREATEGIKLIKTYNLDLTEEGGIPLAFGFHNNIATIYSFMNRNQEALEHYLVAMSLIHEGHLMPWTVITTNLGLSYIEIGETDLGLAYLNKALKFAYFNKLGVSIKQMCHHAFGRGYKILQSYDKALIHFSKAIILAEQSKEKFTLLDTLVGLSRLQLESGYLDEAFRQLVIAERLADELQANNLLWQIKHMLATYYENINVMDKALLYYKAFMDIREKIAGIEVEAMMTAYNTEFKVDKAYQETKLLQIKTDALEKAHSKLMVLSAIGREITSTLDISQIVDKIYDQLRKLMDLNVFAIGMYREEENVLDYIAIIEDNCHLPAYHKALGDYSSYSGQCIRTKEPLLLNNVLIDESKGWVKSREDEAPIHSIIFNPLILEERIIGVITVQSNHSEAYTHNELEIVRILGTYIAIALNNSQKSEELKKAIKELEIASITDSLTGLYNRRYMLKQLEMEHLRYKRYHGPFSIVVGDIDHFKTINDTYGHDAGDEVLKAFAGVLKSALREMDYFSRWGGEEFLILMPESDGQEAFTSAERLRQTVENMSVEYNGIVLKLSITFGIVEFKDEMSIDEAVKLADRTLYKGKLKGRNCSILHEDLKV